MGGREETLRPAHTLTATIVGAPSTIICHNYPISQAPPLLWPVQGCVPRRAKPSMSGESTKEVLLRVPPSKGHGQDEDSDEMGLRGSFCAPWKRHLRPPGHHPPVSSLCLCWRMSRSQLPGPEVPAPRTLGPSHTCCCNQKQTNKP